MEFHFISFNLKQLDTEQKKYDQAASVVKSNYSLFSIIVNKDSSFCCFFLHLKRTHQRETKLENGVWQFVLHNSDNFLSGSHNIQHHHLGQCPSEAGLPWAFSPFPFGGSPHQDATAQINLWKEEAFSHGSHCFWLCLQHVAVQSDVLLVQKVQGWTPIWDGRLHSDPSLWKAWPVHGWDPHLCCSAFTCWDGSGFALLLEQLCFVGWVGCSVVCFSTVTVDVIVLKLKKKMNFYMGGSISEWLRNRMNFFRNGITL